MTGFDGIVVAAGSGTRIGGGVSKALRLLAGRPLVQHAVQTLRTAGAGRIVVVVAADQVPAFEQVLTDVELVSGGVERQHSVRAGLEHLSARGPAPGHAVLVHDAARPLVPPAVVQRVLRALSDGAVAVIPVVPVTDTVRQLGRDGSILLDRSRLRAVQTPQGFDFDVLLAAHRALDERLVTDDAAVCELAGHPVTLVEGSPASVKVTHPIDLVLAELLFAEAEQVGSHR